jgi:hypothetical protein
VIPSFKRKVQAQKAIEKSRAPISRSLANETAAD